jgi:hypothetical protein
MPNGLGGLVGGFASGFARSEEALEARKRAEEQLKLMRELNNSRVALNQAQIDSIKMRNHVNTLDEPMIRQHLALNALAPLSQVPIAQRESFYQTFVKPKLQELGATTIPQNYTPELGSMAQYGYNSLPPGMQAQRLQNDLLKQQLTELEKRKEAQIQAAETPTTYQKQFQTAEAKEDSAFATKIQQGSDNALQIREDAREMLGAGGQIPQEFGVVRGNMMMLTPQGQLAIKNMNKLVLDMFNTMPHIGRGSNLLINIIKRSKPSANIAYPTFVKVAQSYQALSQRAIEYNKFLNYMRNSNITNRNRLSSIWAQYATKYPISDNKGNPLMENLGNWESFLISNPQLIKGKNITRGTSTQQIVPKGFIFPKTPSQSGTIVAPSTTVQNISSNVGGAPISPVAPQVAPQVSAQPIAHMSTNPYDELGVR